MSKHEVDLFNVLSENNIFHSALQRTRLQTVVIVVVCGGGDALDAVKECFLTM